MQMQIRWVVPATPQAGNPPDPAVFNVQQLNVLPVTAKQLVSALLSLLVASPLESISVLGRVLRYSRVGWPQKVKEELKQFSNRRKELSMEEGCILWGIRVVVPTKLRKQVLSELHQGHPGVVRMKSLARSHIWWPGLDQEVEEMVKACTAKKSKTLPQLPHYIRGSGQTLRGLGYMWTLQVRSVARPIW